MKKMMKIMLPTMFCATLVSLYKIKNRKDMIDVIIEEIEKTNT